MKRALLVFGIALALTAPALAAGHTCSLLTKSDAAKFLGTPIASVTPESSQGTDDCRYSNASKSQNVYITVDRSADAPQQMQMLAMAHTQAVTGVGAKAYFQAGTMFVQKGNIVVSVAIYKGQDSMNKMDPQLPALARLVLGKL
jgi:hypothetical protein